MHHSGKGQLNNPVDLDTHEPAEKITAPFDLLNYVPNTSISLENNELLIGIKQFSPYPFPLWGGSTRFTSKSLWVGGLGF